MAHPTINIAINAAHIAGVLMRQEFPKVASIIFKILNMSGV